MGTKVCRYNWHSVGYPEAARGCLPPGANVCVAAPPIRSAIDILMVTTMTLVWSVTNITLSWGV